MHRIPSWPTITIEVVPARLPSRRGPLLRVSSTSLHGPTYAEMRDPARLSPQFRLQAARLRVQKPLHRNNLFHVHWQDETGSVSAVQIPQAVTGLEANLVVLDGSSFPSGSMKVGPAYAMLMERELLQGIRPGQATVVAPSTGNFGIGTAWVSRVKGYEAKVVMPSGMSQERYALIAQYGATTDLTPGSEADVNLTLQRTRDRYADRPDCVVLGQFTDFANYRFHRHVTAQAARDALQKFGLPTADLFVSAPGSAGTLATGEGLRETWPDIQIAAVEPEECATLTHGGRGSHVIEGIGDQMVTLIHNIDATDLVTKVPGSLTIRGTALFSAPVTTLTDLFGVESQVAARLQGHFGPSGICNLIGAIQAARYLSLGPDQTVITVATDGGDRYGSVLTALTAGHGQATTAEMAAWWSEILSLEPERQVLSVAAGGHRNRLHAMKQDTWQEYGVDCNQLDTMRTPEFWDAEYARIGAMDQQWSQLRTPPGDG